MECNAKLSQPANKSFKSQQTDVHWTPRSHTTVPLQWGVVYDSYDHTLCILQCLQTRATL